MRTVRPGGSAGLTLVEVIISMTLFCVGSLSVAGSMGYSLKLDRVNRETATATNAAQRILEDMRALGPEDAFRTYNDSPADDLEGYGTAVGNTFQVANLPPPTGNAAGATGTVLLPCLDGMVREDANIVGLGTVGDLDGNGKIDKADHLLDMKILPIAIRVAWRGATGDRELLLHTVLRR